MFNYDDTAKVTRLSRWIEKNLESSLVTIERAVKLSGGAIQENWLLDLVLESGDLAGNQCWVLRTDAPSSLTTSHTRAEEFAILKTAHEHGAMVPEPLVCCTDTSIIGEEFYLMRWVEGVAQSRQLVRDPELPQFGESLAYSLGHELATIHLIKPPNKDLPFLTEPKREPAAERICRYREYLDELQSSSPALELTLNWLEDNLPECSGIVLCQGDYRTGNYLVHQGKLQAILDWEFANWGDPDEDIGWFTARCWRFGNDHLPAGGIASMQSFCKGYESVANRTINPQRITFWQLMAEVRWGVIAMQQADRHYSGHEESLELALTGRMVAEMEHTALVAVRKALLEQTSCTKSEKTISSGLSAELTDVLRLGVDTPRLLEGAISELEKELTPVLAGRPRYVSAMLKRTLQIVYRESLLERDEESSAESTGASALGDLALAIRNRDRIVDLALVDALLEGAELQLRINNPEFLSD